MVIIGPGRDVTNLNKDFLGWNNFLNSIAEVKGSPKYIPSILADLALAKIWGHSNFVDKFAPFLSY